MIGFARSKKDILGIVQQVMFRKGKKVSISDGWWA